MTKGKAGLLFVIIEHRSLSENVANIVASKIWQIKIFFHTTTKKKNNCRKGKNAVKGGMSLSQLMQNNFPHLRTSQGVTMNSYKF